MNPFNKIIERSSLPRWHRSPDLSRIQQSSPGDETVSLLKSIPPNIRWTFEKESGDLSVRASEVSEGTPLLEISRWTRCIVDIREMRRNPRQDEGCREEQHAKV